MSLCIIAKSNADLPIKSLQFGFKKK